MASDENQIKSCHLVSAGEVCSLAVAEELGIRGGDINHYKNGYDDIKTYSCLSETNKPYYLCEKNGQPSCLLQKNAGFGFTTDPNDKTKSTCITAECPTGFEEDPNNTEICIKPKHESNVVRSSRIDERWNDWFIISNYHLGNKYGKDDSGTKYKPCKSGSVPAFKTDPVDNMVNSSTDEVLSKCIDKEQYFEGKYEDSPEYCPLAWIMRAGATKEDYIAIYKDLINDIREKNGGSDIIDQLEKDAEEYVENNILAQIKDDRYDEYAGFYDSPEIEIACNKLSFNWKRLSKPYEICERIYNGKKEDIINSFMKKNKGMTKTQAEIRYMRTRQACHTVFSDPRGAITQIESDIKKEPLFFEDVEKNNIDFEIENKQDQMEIPLDSTKNDTSKFKDKAAFNIVFSIIVISLSLIIFYFRKNIKDILLKIIEISIKIIQKIVEKVINFVRGFLTINETEKTTLSERRIPKSMNNSQKLL